MKWISAFLMDDDDKQELSNVSIPPSTRNPTPPISLGATFAVPTVGASSFRKRKQHGIRLHQIVFFECYPLDHAVFRADDGVLHFHGFHDE